MRRRAAPFFLAAALTLGAALSAAAQQTPPGPPLPPALELGATAPDFALPGATRFGTLAEPLRLGDYKGKTVVLAFFFRARSRG